MIEETWAIEYKEFEAFFLNLGYIQKKEGYFEFKGSKIQIRKNPGRTLGTISLPSTTISLWGSEEELDALHEKIKLNFFRAGG